MSDMVTYILTFIVIIFLSFFQASTSNLLISKKIMTVVLSGGVHFGLEDVGDQTNNNKIHLSKMIERLVLRLRKRTEWLIMAGPMKIGSWRKLCENYQKRLSEEWVIQKARGFKNILHFYAISVSFQKSVYFL